MKAFLLAALMGSTATAAFAEAETYLIDPGHSQAVISYNHAGFSTTQALLSGWEGEISFDAEAPENSSVTATIPAERLYTGWQARDEHFLQSGDFFDLEANPTVSFTSTGIEVTGENTAQITGDLTLNGVTKPVVLDAVLNSTTDAYPFPPNEGKKAMGIDASTTVVRSEYNLGLFAPFVGDELSVEISIEAVAQDG
ncbi:YceI family protein [Sulfitobacter sp. D35]|uniref:YceI family protein n=1 Tax=Sulfitobacter sp. D35 TaxID=3083252 RepID=UPI00297006D8|nr:YceI family protein [Sulfitobacter sp. D35]MDW4496831.1 YceI family protein [Sulfitobacter sp. D35]